MRSEVVINYALEAKETRGKKTCPGYHGMHVTSLHLSSWTMDSCRN